MPRPSRAHLTFAAICAFLSASGFLSCGANDSTTTTGATGARPNVLLIIADDLKPNLLGFEGDAVVRTPHLDRMASEGTSFSRAYVPLPQCGPSRAALLVGRYPHETGSVTNPGHWNPDHPTIAQLMGARGYRTGFIGKWHLQDDGQPQAGFDEWCSIDRTHLPYEDPVFSVNGTRTPQTGFLTDLLTDRAIEFIDRQRDAPFFLWLAYKTPHNPWTQPPGDEFVYDPGEIRLPVSVDDDLSTKPRTQRDGECHANFLGSTREKLRDALTSYYGMVTSLDANVGRLLAHLDERDIADETLVVFLSDNGFLTGDHQMFTKGPSFYEEQVRTPLVLRQPGRVPAGARLDALVSTLDLLPTFTRLAGGEVPDGLIGRDLMPLTGGEVDRIHDELFLEYARKQGQSVPMLGVITPGAKYVRYLATGEEELYHLADDPHEMTNLARSLEHAEELERLRARVADFQGRIDAPFW